jgi:hypothetical protein
MEVDLEQAIDELYAADLDAFTRLRNAKAKELRGAGEREAADAVAALRKPAVPAWAINRLARTARKDVDVLLDSGHRLREAQRKLLAGGDPKAFATARAKQAEALQKLVTAAEKLLDTERGASSGAMLDRIRATLEAASVTDHGRELLARGRLVEDGAPMGFDALGPADDLVAAGGSAGDERRRHIEQLRVLEGELEAAREEEREREREARDAESEATEAERNARKLAKQAESARARADKAQAAAAQLAERLAELRGSRA